MTRPGEVTSKLMGKGWSLGSVEVFRRNDVQLGAKSCVEHSHKFEITFS